MRKDRSVKIRHALTGCLLALAAAAMFVSSPTPAQAATTRPAMSTSTAATMASVSLETTKAVQVKSNAQRRCAARWRPCHYRKLRLKLWHGELEHRGQWYVYGAAGPSTFDCSGLVYYDAGQRGISLPRTTYDMIGSYHLVRTYHPKAGNLAFYGTGHVEMFDRPGYTFGAHHSGTRIGYTHYSSSYHPTSYWRVVRKR